MRDPAELEFYSNSSGAKTMHSQPNPKTCLRFALYSADLQRTAMVDRVL